MNPQVILLNSHQINWDILTKLGVNILHRSVTKSIDNANMKLGEYSSYIGILGEIKYPGIRVQEILDNPGNLISHLSFTFIIISFESDIVDIALESKLSATIINYNQAQCLSIVSGSLDQWRTAIINCCVPQSNENVRSIFNQIFKEFEKLGLHKLWYEYNKVNMKDGTFLLEKK